MASQLFRFTIRRLASKRIFTITNNYHQRILYHSSNRLHCKMLETSEKDVVVKSQVFVSAVKKNRTSFVDIVNSFKDSPKLQRGHVEFIYAALKAMQEFNAQADLTCYKKLLDIFPKGKMIPKNMIQAEFFHFPRHQDCAIEILDQMERYVVCPDKEMSEIILNTFGKSSVVFKKYCRMIYWIPKIKNLNPFDLPDPIPSDIEVLAELALKKMSFDVRTKISHFKAEDIKESLDKTWIVSAQSVEQQKLLKRHDKEKPLYVEGAFIEWMSRLPVSYFILRADPAHRPVFEVDDDDVSNLSLYMFGEPKPKELTIRPSSVHEQEDATIFGMCATGTSSKDSVLSWIRFLQQTNPVLDKIPILFTLKSPPTSLVSVNAPNADFSNEDGVTQEKT